MIKLFGKERSIIIHEISIILLHKPLENYNYKVLQ